MKIKALTSAVIVTLFFGVLATPPLALSGRTPFLDFLSFQNGKILNAALAITPGADGGLVKYWEFWCLRLKNCEWGGSGSDFLYSVTPEEFATMQ
ncbi:hypothetical protein [Leisingera sp. ANG-Vp]|uniref:hypothetical protein n=1 Tax=Leisingera sp. ANG-Vp TaxID=1577896 RepID=UPI001269A7EA|nr:hypothetical protein [Leisingera sp. ANG-Vp]